MVIYNIQTNGVSSQLVIELKDASVYLEPSFIAYMIGSIVLDATAGRAATKALAYFIGRKYFRPSFRGTGKIYLKATLGSYHKFILDENEPLIIAPRSFIACRDAIKVEPQIKPSLTKFLSGMPMINTLVTGNGELMVLMPGPLVEVKLQQTKFVAYDSNVAAYSCALKVTSEKAGSGWMSVADKIVKVYRGTGSLYFTPQPNKDSKVDIK